VNIIDFRSDTVTSPTDEMRHAMYQAEVGDDGYGEDPSINALERLAARTLGKEAAIFTASGTMSNLLAILTQTHRGDEILLGSESHTLWFEMGGASALGSVMMRALPNRQDGTIDLDLIEESIRNRNINFPQTTLLCLENTHNRCGGMVLTPAYTSAATKLAHHYDLRVHLDGARIFNAATALNIPASKLAMDVDSVCLCLSKGLSAPVGSLLCGTHEFVESARRWRKMLGGGMRQAGIVAAAGIVALETMVTRLVEDHDNARHLANGMSAIPGISIPHEVQTNIVMFETPPTITAADFLQQMNERGVKFNHRGGNRYRAVTHRMISSNDIDEALNRIEAGLKEIS
jgi:threonine aldolase